MATKSYEYNDVINACSSNSKIANDLKELQYILKDLNKDISKCEDYFHGKSYNSRIYKSYDELYEIIGKENKGGCWDLVYKIINTLNTVKGYAQSDLDAYNAEVEEENRRFEEMSLEEQSRR